MTTSEIHGTNSGKEPLDDEARSELQFLYDVFAGATSKWWRRNSPQRDSCLQDRENALASAGAQDMLFMKN
jgi:hypothetical protein